MSPSQLTGSEMGNLVYALGGLFVGLMIGNAAIPPKPKKRGSKSEEPVRYTKIMFQCWLRSGETIFDASPHHSKTKTYDRECKWCGMENRVEVKPMPSKK